MLKTRVFSAAATMALAAAAFAQPAVFTDLGDLSLAASNNVATPALCTNAAGTAGIKWFKAILPSVTTTGGFIDLWTNGITGTTTTYTDTEIGVYDSTGAFKTTDDDDGPGFASAISYGITTAGTNRPLTVGIAPLSGSGIAYNGRDGVLTGGVYWIAVAGFNATFNTTAWNVTTTAAAGSTGFYYNILPNLAPSNPTGAVVNTPASGLAGSSFTTTCAVTPGANPPTTGHGVTVDTSPIGGGIVTLLDDGVAPDVTAGDNIFTANLTVSAATTSGVKTLTYTITDAQARPGTTTGNFSVTELPPANDLCANATPAFVGATNPFSTVWALTDGLAAACGTPNKDVWFTFDPPSSGDYQFDTIGCGFDSLLVAYTGCGGTELACNDDGGGSLTSKFNLLGLVAGTPVTIRVGGFSTASGTGNLHILGLTPTAPTAAGSQTPTAPLAGTTVLLKATVTPGAFPVTTNHTVTVDMTSLIGGSATQTFYDDGTNGDVTVGDNIFSYNFPIDSAQGDGTYSCAISINDAEGRPGSGTLNVTVIGTPQWDEITNGLSDAGNSVATAQAPVGAGSLSNIQGHFAAGEDVDMYRIQICDFANFSATTVHPITNGQDTQLFLFDFAGNAIQMDDDNPLAGGGLSSQMGNQFVTANGDSYIAVAHYDVDPLNAGGFPIWEDTPFNVVRAPDGLTNGGDITLASWSGTYATAFDYRLVMTGVCFPCLADYNRDGTVDFFDYLDFVDAFSMGTADFNLDGTVDFFDYLDFVDRFSIGC